MIIAPDGPACSCGARGCFEALASGSALAKAGHEAAAGQAASRLSREQAHRAITARDVVAAAREGDELAAELIQREARWLGIGFANLAHLYSPEAIVMGGGVSQAFDLLEPGITTAFQSCAMPPFRAVRIVPALLGDNAGLTGAAAFVLEGERRAG
jgi:glucokinase